MVESGLKWLVDSASFLILQQKFTLFDISFVRPEEAPQLIASYIATFCCTNSFPLKLYGCPVQYFLLQVQEPLEGLSTV